MYIIRFSKQICRNVTSMVHRNGNVKKLNTFFGVITRKLNAFLGVITHRVNTFLGVITRKLNASKDIINAGQHP